MGLVDRFFSAGDRGFMAAIGSIWEVDFIMKLRQSIRIKIKIKIRIRKSEGEKSAIRSQSNRPALRACGFRPGWLNQTYA